MSSDCGEKKCLMSVVVEAARAFLLCLLSLSKFFLSTSNWAAAWWIVWRKATQSAARSDHCLWSMLQAVSDFFRLSLNPFFGAPLTMTSEKFAEHDDLWEAMVLHNSHLRTRGKCTKREPQASIFYISRVFSNDRSVS